MTPRIPPNLNTPFFHLLTVEDLEERRALWLYVIDAATNPKAVEIARARLRRVETWLGFYAIREEWRRTCWAPGMASAQARQRELYAPSIAPEIAPDCVAEAA